jgi:DNA-binding PadR family transcriptional regulator
MITARTALLQALREGPGYGRDFVRRISQASAGRLRCAEGSIYPALRRLEAARLVRSWGVVPGRRRGGRARTYYELTERGVKVSEADRAALLRLAAPEGDRPPGRAECRRMLERIELGAELSETAGRLLLRAPRSHVGRVACR